MALADDKPGGKGFTVNDQRWWLREGEVDRAAEAAGSESKPTYVADLERQLEEQGHRLLELQAAVRGGRDEIDQVRQRLEREHERRLEVERARLAEPFAEVLDNLARLLAACRAGRAEGLLEGAALVVRQLEERLAELGLRPIEAAGQPFDPNTMEAMLTSPVEAARAGRVLEVIRPGYLLGERVVRPAGVRVGVATEE